MGTPYTTWDAIKRLFKSRKFLLALVAVVLIVLQNFGLDPTLVEAINQILLIIIAAITVEDAAEKLGVNIRNKS